MMLKKQSKGISLLELIVSCAILTVVSGAIVVVFQSAMRDYRQQSMVSDTLKSNSIALTKIIKEIMRSEAVYCPNDRALADLKTSGELLASGFKPLSAAGCLAFKIKMPAGDKRVIGYYLDTGAGQIKRVIFDSGANENPTTWTIAAPANQITSLANVRRSENFSYNGFSFKFDRAYASLNGHSPEEDPKQILVISIDINRTSASGNLGGYPLSAKVWLERNGGIYRNGQNI